LEDLTSEEILKGHLADNKTRKHEFFRYYNNKRMLHQLTQLKLLRDVEGDNLTEIGPYLGFSTGLFLASGFKVHTVDVGPPNALGELTPNKHTRQNIRDITQTTLAGSDVIVCCEVLEHLIFSEAEETLAKFHSSGAQSLLISVPYRCFSIDIRIMYSSLSSFFSWIVKLPSKRFKKFQPEPEPEGHKWELGYKGYPLPKLLKALDKAGFQVAQTEYLGAVRSVFILSHRKQ